MIRRLVRSMTRVRLALVPIALALAGLALLPGATEPVHATHGDLDVHVHDDYFHPAGAFGVPTNHALAQTECQVAKPDPECDAVIHAGDTITWVAPPPTAMNTHTVTECTSNTFSTCGAAVDPANPIGDSGLRTPSGWPYGPIQFNTPGTYYYRCEVHPTVMRGRIVVQEAPVGGVAELPDAATTPLEASGGSGANLRLIAGLAAAAAAGFIALGGGVVWYARRRAV